jgi:FtsP/CotA-like multicopper oxidase with cupredoxin domain
LIDWEFAYPSCIDTNVENATETTKKTVGSLEPYLVVPFHPASRSPHPPRMHRLRRLFGVLRGRTGLAAGSLALLSILGSMVLGPVPAFAQATAAATPKPEPVQPVSDPCPRYKAGSVVHNPPALYSQNGVLDVRFSYQQATDYVGRTLYCYMTPEGLEDPTLHLNPGDTLNITITNNTPSSPVEEPFHLPNCGDSSMTGSSVNIHYHGTNTSPTCHADDVVKTLINSGTTFQYSVEFPANEPPGLYWYHPHVHGISEAAVNGGLPERWSWMESKTCSPRLPDCRSVCW